MGVCIPRCAQVEAWQRSKLVCRFSGNWAFEMEESRDRIDSEGFRVPWGVLVLSFLFNVQGPTMLHSGSNYTHHRNLLAHDTRSVTPSPRVSSSTCDRNSGREDATWTKITISLDVAGRSNIIASTYTPVTAPVFAPRFLARPATNIVGRTYPE